MIHAILLLSALTVGSFRDVPVDMIEHNHCNVYGSSEYSQVILWEWCPLYRRYDVVGWFMVEDKRWSVTKYGDRSIVKLVTRDGSVLVFSTSIMRETWTQVDPERENKKLRGETQRRKLPRKGLLRFGALLEVD
jgi:hypothetical protein